MTYEVVDCPICKKNIGRFHGQDVTEKTARHISQEHKSEYADIGEKNRCVIKWRGIIHSKKEQYENERNS